MDNTFFNNESNPIIGIPYKNIVWEDIPGQPFGIASQFNLFVFGDANNIVDVEGAIAVGGSFYSPRSLSIGFQRKKGLVPIEFSPDLVRYLVGNNVVMKGPLVTIGHAVSGGSFRAGLGSTYYIGKNNLGNQMDELKYLYSAAKGSPYWTPSDKGEYYLIPSYDVPRIIPAARIAANINTFFQEARRSIEAYKQCIENLNDNGSVTNNYHEWILTGNNPEQNIFTLDVRPNGLINKGIRFNIPEGSVAIVRLKTGPHAHLQYGLYGEERHAKNILYVFEDAQHIHMEKSSDFWGSILAPGAMFHGHPTGGHVSGNAILGGFAVKESSGFEFHLYPFAGGVSCMNMLPIETGENIKPIIVPQIPEVPVITPISPIQESPIIETPAEETPIMEAPVIPPQIPVPSPLPPTTPEILPVPEIIPCPPCPMPLPCPVAQPCPECPTCPEQILCPTCPICPEAAPCPTCPDCPTCPEYHVCPVCPEQKSCPESETEYIAVPIPIPVPVEMEFDESLCPECEECVITPGIIAGCVVGCDCCRNHEWDVMLYQVIHGRKRLVYCITICHMGYFEFEVDYEEEYILQICPADRNCFTPKCKPEVKFYNIGVSNIIIKFE